MLETECLNSSKELERIIIEHPAGKIQTEFAIKEVNDKYVIKKSSIIRTARLLFKGEMILS